MSDVPIAVFLVLFSNFVKEASLAKDCLLSTKARFFIKYMLTNVSDKLLATAHVVVDLCKSGIQL